MKPKWRKIYDAAAHLECLALTAPAWGRAILFREIKALDRFALHIVEPIEADGLLLPSFCRSRLASLLVDLRPLAALTQRSDAAAWGETIDALLREIEVHHAAS
jgi:hypothetical protein